MANKKSRVLIIILMMLILIMILIPTISFGREETVLIAQSSWSHGGGGGSGFGSSTSSSDIINPNEYEPPNIGSGGEIGRIGNIIIGSIQLIGSIVSVIALLILGIKYMMGSIEEKAEYKETMKPYIIGAVMVFSITVILGALSDILK